jgi:[acyl-carrier-protein] S-malonyltransferase
MSGRLFLFPGQGSQAVGMGKYLFDVDPAARETFEEADAALGEPLSKLILEGPEETLKETANAQPAILTVSVAAARVLRNRGIKPVAMAGHSLGEYSALVLSGALRFPDAVRLVRMRGRFMQEAVPLGAGTMSAVLGADEPLVEEVCREISARGMVVEPANYNCPGQLVISGTVDGVAAAVARLAEKGVKKCVPLKVSAPFHCSLLRPAAERLAVELSKVPVRDPEVPYIANVDCSIVRKAEGVIPRLVDQVHKPVRWTQSLERLVQDFRPEAMVEVGPGQVVNGHMKKVAPDLKRYHTDTLEGLNAVV